MRRDDPGGTLRASLRLRRDDGQVLHLLLDRPLLHIGRARDGCGLVLPGPDIAPQHCCVRRQGDRWWLLDRGAPAGTYLDSRRCREPTPLQHGDRISIGLHLLEFTTSPAHTLRDTLARLGGLDPTPDEPPPPTPTPRSPRRPTGPLRAACLAATAALAVTLPVAANFTPSTTRSAAARAARSGAVPSNLSPGTSSDITEHPTRSAPDGLTDPPIKTTDHRAAPPPNDLIKYLVEPPIFELPTDALARGRPDAGTLERALQLPPSEDYLIRCPAHAHASSATAAELMRALATFRNRSGYRGEVVVGDVSRAGGGRYGPHRSHQSGRDVDLWLPILGGRYRRGCVRCGTDLCRPAPAEVDWRITWELISALAARGQVQDVFLAWHLQPELRAAALELGVPEAELARQIQHPVRGRASLIKHARDHTHHMHVRFRCPADDPGCTASR